MMIEGSVGKYWVEMRMFWEKEFVRDSRRAVKIRYLCIKINVF
jgi:hypothetical protein